jgi:transposase
MNKKQIYEASEKVKKDQKRFESKINKTSLCWIWKGQICPTGYGAFWLRKNMTAHRASWILYHGEIPENLCVCHACDNRKCVNPKHLFLGTHKDNMQDCKDKGRLAPQKRQLNEEQENEVIHKYLDGISQRKIAKQYGIHQATLWRYIHKYIPIKDCKGEGNNKSKFTEKQIQEIRSLYIPRKMGAHRIAKKYGVEKSTIQRIIKRETWKHI